MKETELIKKTAAFLGTEEWDLLIKKISQRSYQFLAPGFSVSSGNNQQAFLRYFQQERLPLTIISDLHDFRNQLHLALQISNIFAPEKKSNYRPLFSKNIEYQDLHLFSRETAAFNQKKAQNFYKEMTELLLPETTVLELSLVVREEEVSYRHYNNFFAEYQKSIFQIELKTIYNQELITIREKAINCKTINIKKLSNRINNILSSVTGEFCSEKLPELIILTPEAATTIITAFAFQLKSAKYRQQILAGQFVNLADFPQSENLSGSVLFDDEGHQGITTIIEKGIFKNPIATTLCLQNRKSSSPANAFYRNNNLESEFTNLILSPGDLSFSKMLHSDSRIILITYLKKKSSSSKKALFSGYAYLIRHGMIEKSIKVLLETSLRTFFMKLKMLSSELKFIHNNFNCGCPYLLAETKSENNQKIIL